MQPEQQSDHAPAVAPVAGVRYTLRLALIGISYFVCLELAFLFPVSRQLLGTVWPAAGVSLAALLLNRRSSWRGILLVLFVAGILANVVVGRSVWISGGYVLSDLLESTLCALVITALGGDQERVGFGRVKEVFALILAATVVNAFTALAGSAIATLSAGARFWPFWMSWWVGDGLGILLVTPAIVTWSSLPPGIWDRLHRRRLVEFALFIAIWCAASFWLLNRPREIGPVYLHGYVLMALIAWGALRLGQRTVSLALVLAAGVAISGAWIRASHDIPFGQLVQLQMLLGTMGITGLLLAASFSQAREAERASREDQERLKASEAKYRDIFDNAAGALFVSTIPQGRYLKVNHSAAQMFGFDTPQEMIDQITDIVNQMYVDPSDRQRLVNAMQANGDEVTGFESQLKKRDGSHIWVSMNARLIRDEQGRPTHMEGMSMDITERRRLDGLNRLQSEIATNIAEGIYLVSAKDLTIVYANPKMESMFGYGPGEVIGRHVSILNSSTGDDPEEIARRIQEELDRSGSWRGETLNVRKDGWTFWGRATVSVLHHPEYGKVYVSVQSDVTDQRELEEERQRLLLAEQDARKLAESASAAKDQFIATLSHELRTPLTPAILVLSGWRRSAQLNPALRDDIEMTLRNLQTECQLIDDLLDTTRIARGKLVLNFAECDLADLARRCVLMFAAGPGARIDLELPAGPIAIEADAVRIKQVIWNLLSNARKFTPANGRVVLRAGVENGDHSPSAWLSVSDTGSGISPADQGRLFEPFKQVVNDEGNRPHGLGLGLSICRGIALAHGGEVSCSSEGLGKGSQFTLRIPARGPNSRGNRDDGSIAMGASLHAPAASSIGTAIAKTASSQPWTAQAFSILVLEDHEDTALMLTRVLTSAGHRAHACSTLAEARDELSTWTPDLMICDLSLPDGLAYALMGELRASSRAIPSLAVSGFGSPDDVRQSLQAGFAQHLTKPVSGETIMDAIHSLMRAQRVGAKGD